MPDQQEAKLFNTLALSPLPAWNALQGTLSLHLPSPQPLMSSTSSSSFTQSLPPPCSYHSVISYSSLSHISFTSQMLSKCLTNYTFLQLRSHASLKLSNSSHTHNSSLSHIWFFPPSPGGGGVDLLYIKLST